MLKLYENIKRLRKEAGLTQEELAHKVGYTDRSSIAKIESGVVDIPQSKIKQFADIFGVTPGYLLGAVSDEKSKKNAVIAKVSLLAQNDDEYYVILERILEDKQYRDLVAKIARTDEEKFQGMCRFSETFL